MWEEHTVIFAMWNLVSVNIVLVIQHSGWVGFLSFTLFLLAFIRSLWSRVLCVRVDRSRSDGEQWYCGRTHWAEIAGPAWSLVLGDLSHLKKVSCVFMVFWNDASCTWNYSSKLWSHLGAQEMLGGPLTDFGDILGSWLVIDSAKITSYCCLVEQHSRYKFWRDIEYP
jgi:hypothetical protein